MRIETPAITLKGLYRIHAVNAQTGEVEKNTGWFDNLITNEGLDQIGFACSSHTTYQYNMFDTVGLGTIRVGAGTSLPSVDNWALENEVAASTNTFSSTFDWDFEGGYFIHRRAVEFSAGTITVPISEVGSGKVNNIFSRALVEGGSFTVASNQVLRVEYELRINFPALTEQTFSLNLEHDAVSTPVTVKVLPMRMSANNGDKVYYTGNSTSMFDVGHTYGQKPSFYQTAHSSYYTYRAVARNGSNTDASSVGSGSTSRPNSASLLGYSRGDYERALRCTWGTTSANWSEGIVGISFKSYFMVSWQFEFVDPIPKASNNVFEIELVTKWGRA